MTPQWKINEKPVTSEDLEGYVAFVYLITNLSSGRKYFGQKKLQFTTHKRLKGRKNRIKVVKESDWESYYGSSKSLQADVELLGKENFKREIIRLCKKKSEANYWELYYQMNNHALLNPKEYYNDYCGGRISRKQLGIK